MELSQQRAPDALTLQRRLDVDAMQLRFGRLAVVVEEADEAALPLGDQEVGVISHRTASDARAQRVERVALRHDRLDHRRAGDDVLIRLGDGDLADRSDVWSVCRAGVADCYDGSHCAGHKLCLRVGEPAQKAGRMILSRAVARSGHATSPPRYTPSRRKDYS